MKAYRGRRGTAPLILNFGTRWKWVFNFMPRPASSLYADHATPALPRRTWEDNIKVFLKKWHLK